MNMQKEIADKLRASGKNQLAMASKIFTEGLAASEATPIVRITEDLFLREFLPYIVGDIEASPNGSLYNSWLGVGASPTQPVAVVKGNEELFQIPPLWDTSHDRIDDPKVGLRTMVMGYGKYNQAGQGQAFLMQQLPKATAEILGGQNVLGEAAVALRAIVSRYRPDIVAPVAEAKAAAVEEDWMKF